MMGSGVLNIPLIATPPSVHLLAAEGGEEEDGGRCGGLDHNSAKCYQCH